MVFSICEMVGILDKILHFRSFHKLEYLLKYTICFHQINLVGVGL